MKLGRFGATPWLFLLGMVTMATVLGVVRQNQGADETVEPCPAPEVLLRLANEGQPSAQFVVGYKLLHEAKPDAVRAVDWMLRAAEQGHLPAQAALGRMFLEGEELPKDLARASIWLLRAAEQGDQEAQYRLQKIYADGVGVPKDYFEASHWKYVAQANPDKSWSSLAASLRSLPSMQARPTMVDYQPFAEQGNPLAQYKLGRLHLDAPYGQGDEKTGVEWLRRAAAQGHTQAMADLASVLAKGARGVAANDAEAMALMRAAAKQNLRIANNAMWQLIDKINTGNGALSYEQRRFQWTQAYAEMGDARAQNRLAEMYMAGTGVKADAKKAALLYQHAAELGGVQSQYDLARLYLTGKGVTKDLRKAYFWWFLAFRNGRTDGELATPGFWHMVPLSDRVDIEEAVRGWVPASSIKSSGNSLAFEMQCTSGR